MAAALTRRMSLKPFQIAGALTGASNLFDERFGADVKCSGWPDLQADALVGPRNNAARVGQAAGVSGLKQVGNLFSELLHPVPRPEAQ